MNEEKTEFKHKGSTYVWCFDYNIKEVLKWANA